MYAFEIYEHPEESRTEYWFTTDSYLRYYAYIIAADDWTEGLDPYPFLQKYGYAFGFCPVDEDEQAKSSHDPRVGQTICAIISHFMSDFSQIVLIYHCDSADGRQQFRNKTFQTWFAKHSDLEKIHRDKITIEVKLEDGVKNEYLGYFAKCDSDATAKLSSEFEMMANEKVNSSKQQLTPSQSQN